MPVAAIDSEEYKRATACILESFLHGKPLSPFERKSFEILSEKLALLEDRLQLSAMLYLADGNEDSFYKTFEQAILASNSASITRCNYTAALAVMGDWEGAAAQLRENLKNPVDVVRTGILETCIEHAYQIMEPDLAEEFIRLAEKSNYKITGSLVGLQRILGALPDDDPLLLAGLDAIVPEDTAIDDACLERSERLLDRCRTLVEGVEADHA